MQIVPPLVTGTGLPINLPLDIGLSGVNLFSQGATFSPGLNPRGIITSNGSHGIVGL